jgi:glucose-6-phosphate isomerase
MRFFTDHAGISFERVPQAPQGVLQVYAQELCRVVRSGRYDVAESSLCLSSDAELSKRISSILRDVGVRHLRLIVVIGIGGSNLGTKAVYEGLRGLSGGKSKLPRMLFADTCETSELLGIADQVSALASSKEVLIVMISKSGSTTETAINTDVIVSKLHKRFSDIQDRLVVITDEGSPLMEAAQQKGIRVCSMPASVGGRFSVFSAVGLLPLQAAGVDTAELCRGAWEMREQCLAISFKKNPAMQSAWYIFEQAKRGKAIINTFVFHPQLESLGKWYRQLAGESLGKETVRGKKRINILPVVSVGSTDLHSVGQRYLGGARDISTMFVWASAPPLFTPSSQRRLWLETPSTAALAGVSPQQVMTAIREGVMIAYQKNHLPFVGVDLEEISAYSLGAFLQWKMCEVMFLGKLCDVNTFDQPDVERYKKETRKLLSRN